MNVKLLSILLLTTITACTVNPEQKNNNIVSCKDPRPQMCTMDYNPVCGFISPNQIKTFSNGCVACSDSKVLSHTNNVCRDDSLDIFINSN